MYALARKLLFQLDPEVAHELSLDNLNAAERLGLLSLLVKKPPPAPRQVMGLTFPNPVGLAAGLDKNGDYFNALGKLGFGFVEIGTVTPLPQAGNPQPRLFRLPGARAIINRMGFNNKGVDHLVAQVERRRFEGVLGINIGKNKHTPEARALDDYLLCLEKVYPCADYVTVNLSSPNTPGLRRLQFGDALAQLLGGIKNRQAQLAVQHGRYVPIAVKIAPDMDDEQVAAMCETLLQAQIDAVIATNTTVSRSGVEGLQHGGESGGLSGAPLFEASCRVLRQMAQGLQGHIPVIACGGVMEGAQAVEKMRLGASLVQLYSGFIYRGPGLVVEAADAIASAHAQ